MGMVQEPEKKTLKMEAKGNCFDGIELDRLTLRVSQFQLVKLERFTALIAKVSLVGGALGWVLFTGPPGGWGRVCTSQRRFCTT